MSRRARTRRLWRELGLIGPVSRKLWKTAGIWDEDPGEPGVRGVPEDTAR